MFLKYVSLTYTLPNKAMEKYYRLNRNFSSSLLFMSIINEHNPSHEYATISTYFNYYYAPGYAEDFNTCFY